MTILAGLFSLLLANAHALTFEQIHIGSPVELAETVEANKLLSNAMLMCRLGNHAVYPKIQVGPNAASDGANVRYFKVSFKATDPFTYTVYLMSEQLPCGCVLTLHESPAYLNGNGDDFKMLSEVRDLRAMKAAPAVATACSNLPGWMPGLVPSAWTAEMKPEPNQR